MRLGARTLVSDAGPASLADELPAEADYVGDLRAIPEGVDLVVTSPGLRPDHPLLAEAAGRGIEALGELEFAWRLRAADAAPWLMVTGTNGKTTTVRMLESILRAAGLRALAVGNVGVPVIDAVLAEPAWEVLAVEASSFQLQHSSTIRPRAGALLNLAEDHLDWHGSMAAYAAAKARVWAGDYAIANADDQAILDLLEATAPSGERVTFKLGDPLALEPSEIRPSGPHNVSNALAAAALARTVGVTEADTGAGLRAFVPDAHRNQFVLAANGIEWVDDSKATNPHAAAASLAAHASVVWIAGGQLKGASMADLVAQTADRLRGVVLIGADRDVFAAALARHAPDVPVITVSRDDDGLMLDVVRAATSLAAAGDVVLLAPAAASLDQFDSYAARGDAFVRAVRALTGVDS